MLGKLFDYRERFPPLGNPEHHFNKYPEHPWYKNKKDIESWLCVYVNRKKGNDEFIIHDDLTVSIDGDVFIDADRLNGGKIKVKFRKCKDFDCHNNLLTTLVGVPYICNSINASINNLKNLEGVKESLVNNLIDVSYNDLKSFLYMPNLKNCIDLKVGYNGTLSWDGFTNCKEINIEWIWSKTYVKNEDERNLVSFIMSAPKELEKISVNAKVSDIIFENNNLNVDMEWLRNEQEKNKKIKNTKSKIEHVITLNNNINKRKL